MKRIIVAVVLVVILAVSVCAAGDKQDKAMLEMRAQVFAERIMRLKLQNEILVAEHNKAVRELQAIIKILEQMEKGNKS